MYNLCNSACPPVCGENDFKMCTRECRSGCGCPKGQYRLPDDENKCVNRENCPKTGSFSFFESFGYFHVRNLLIYIATDLITYFFILVYGKNDGWK